MFSKNSFKRKLYVFFASTPFLFYRWSIKKKLRFSFFILILILGVNALFTYYEVVRLREHQLNLNYLIYLDILGVLTGCLFVWVLSNSVLRRMKKIIEKLENRSALGPINLYGNDELGELARAVSYIRQDHSSFDERLEEKNLLIRAILNHAIDGIIIFDSKGRISSHSQSFKTLVGYLDEEIEQNGIEEILPKLDLDEINRVFLDKSKSPKFKKQELEIRKKNGKLFQINLSICPIQGKQVGTYIAIARKCSKTQSIRRLFQRYSDLSTDD